MKSRALRLVLFSVAVILLGWASCYLEVDRKEGSNQCTEGDCCDENGFVRPSEFMCREEPKEEYRCSQEQVCGTMLQKKYVETYCSGDRPDCSGFQQDQWKDDHLCESMSCEGNQCYCKNECCQEFYACNPEQTECIEIGLFWAVGVGSDSYDSGQAIAANSGGAFAIAGVFESTIELDSSKTFTSKGNKDSFLAKYDPSGSFEWAIQVGGSQDDQVRTIGWTSDDSYIFIGGSFGYQVTFEGAAGNPLEATGQDAFLAKFNRTNNNFDWALHPVGDGNEEITDLAVLSDDSVVVTGEFINGIEFSAEDQFVSKINNQDIFLAQYDTNGSFVWARHAGSETGAGEIISAQALAINGDSILVTGEFNGTIVFYKQIDSITLSSASPKSDIFMAIYKTDGTLINAVRAGGENSDSGYGVAALPTNSDFVVCGQIEGDADFPNDAGKIQVGSSTLGAQLFLAYLDTDLNTHWVQTGGGPGDTIAKDVDIHPNNPSVIKMTGDFSGQSIFGPGQDTEMVLNSWGMTDIFIARFNTDGNFLWVSQAGGTATTSSSNAIFTLQDGTSFVTGDFDGSWNFDGINITTKSKTDIFILLSQ